MELFQRHQNIFIGSAIFAVVVIIYFIFFGGSKPEQINTGSFLPTSITAGGLVSELSASPSDLIVGADLLQALSQMKNINLNTAPLADPSFKSLKDTSKVIAPEPFGKSTGRKNPFSGFAQ